MVEQIIKSLTNNRPEEVTLIWVHNKGTEIRTGNAGFRAHYEAPALNEFMKSLGVEFKNPLNITVNYNHGEITIRVTDWTYLYVWSGSMWKQYLSKNAMFAAHYGGSL